MINYKITHFGMHVNGRFTDLIDLTAVEMSQSNPNFEVFPSVLHQEMVRNCFPTKFLDEITLLNEIYEHYGSFQSIK